MIMMIQRAAQLTWQYLLKPSIFLVVRSNVSASSARISPWNVLSGVTPTLSSSSTILLLRTWNSDFRSFTVVLNSSMLASNSFKVSRDGITLGRMTKGISPNLVANSLSCSIRPSTSLMRSAFSSRSFASSLGRMLFNWKGVACSGGWEGKGRLGGRGGKRGRGGRGRGGRGENQ